ncbi:hypothetical protein SBV1_2070008 [Verrucomicrobia bacterium]|nr:hypothetical protein SBV1_2070008 [Verrucomicrobiota bacterium]
MSRLGSGERDYRSSAEARPEGPSERERTSQSQILNRFLICSARDGEPNQNGRGRRTGALSMKNEKCSMLNAQ